MTFRRLQKLGRGHPEPAYPQQPPTQRFAAPPGPPPQWPQWQTPGQSSPPAGERAGRHGRSASSSAAFSSSRVLSRDDEMKRLLKACNTGKGNAQLLHEAVVYAKPEDLEGNELIKEFLKKCRVTQEYISAAIPWATAESERSREGITQGQETKEEKLLAELLTANQELLDALNMYNELEQAAVQQKKDAERKMRAFDALTKFIPNSSESDLVNRIFEVGDPLGNSYISINAAQQIFHGSELPADILQSIWDIANVEENENIERHCVGVAVRLVGYAQKGEPITEESVTKAGPLAVFSTLDHPHLLTAPHSEGSHNWMGSNSSSPFASLASPGTLPPLTSQDRAKFMKIFLNSSPENGEISGHRARDILQRSRLPQETLGQIWDLADIRRRGALDASSFTIAMYLIQACMSGQIQSVPLSLPPYLYAEAAQLSPAAPTFDSQYLPGIPQPSTRNPTPPVQSLIDLDDSTIPTQMPTPTILGQPVTPQRTPPLSPPRSPLSPGAAAIWHTAGPLQPSPLQRTPTTSSPPTFPTPQPSIPAGWNWDVSPTDKVSSDKFFDQLDPWKHGYVEGEAAVPFLSKSKLSGEDLAGIWDLADLDHDGKLTREEFAVVMYLIRSRLAGRKIPETLPPSLVPPANLPDLLAEAETNAAANVPSPIPAEASGQRSHEPPPPYEEPDVNNIPEPTPEITL